MIKKQKYSSALLRTAIIVLVAAVGSQGADLVTAGDFTLIYDPSVGETERWYINDHCIAYGIDGWHMFGITHAEPANPSDEDNLAHATATTLTRIPWTKHPFALSAIADPWMETHLWAPHVVNNEGRYYMFYCGGSIEGSTRYRIHLATSTDLWTWTRHPENPMLIDGYDARDPMVVRIDNQWIMYYTATSTPSGGNHVVKSIVSDDLLHWSDERIVFTDPSTGTSGGPTESPFVVRRGSSYYLFIGARGGYDGTDVFVSNSPHHWDPVDKAGHIGAHAPEVVRDIDGSWHVTRCGWDRGGLYLAPLYWHDGLDNEETSMPAPVFSNLYRVMDHPHDTMVMEGYSLAGYQTFDLQVEGRALSVIAPGRQAWTIGCYSLDGSCLYKGRGRGTETITMTKSARFRHRLVIAVARKGRTIVTRQRMFH